MFRRSTAALLALSAFALAARSAEPLRWKWAAGDSVRYLTEQTMNMQMTAGPAGNINSTTTQAMLIDWNVDAVEDNGTATLSQQFERITMKTNGPMGQGFQYDSASDEPPSGMAALVAPMFDAIVSAPIVVEVLPTGEYVDVRLSDELAEAVEDMPGGAMSVDAITQMTKQSSIAFPEKELAPGESWTQTAQVNAPQVGKMLVTTTYTYNGEKDVDGRALESFTPRIEIGAPPTDGAMAIDFKTRDSSGEILFDREAGRIVSSRVEQTMDIVIQMNGQTINNQMTQKTEMRELAPGESPLPAPAEASMAE